MYIYINFTSIITRTLHCVCFTCKGKQTQWSGHALCACMRAVLYKKTPRFLEMFSLWHVIRKYMYIYFNYIYYIYKKKFNEKYCTACRLCEGNTRTETTCSTHALCACMRAVLYKKTPRFLEMFSLWHIITYCVTHVF